ncbi:MAG: hypothetical protein R3B47_02020 [Bacteroidia bacterium]
MLAFLSFVQMALAQNDDCSGATLITPGTYFGTTVGATADGTPFCNTNNTAPGVWYKFTGNGGQATLSTCGAGTNYDTKLHVYTGTCGSLVCQQGNDDDFSCGFGSLRSTVSFTTSAGTEYLVVVSGFSSNTGSYELFFGLTTPIVVPANDLCANATSLDVSAGTRSVSGTTLGSTFDGAPFCGTSNTSSGVWYTFTGNGNFVTLSTCAAGSSYDTKLTVYAGGCGVLDCIDGNDDDFSCGFGTLRSTLSFLTSSGVTYHVLVHGFSSNAGSYELTVESILVIPPANDDCANAEVIADGDTKTGDTRFAADESSNPSVGACGGISYDNSGGVWYVYHGDGDAVTFATCGSDYDTKLSVYQAFPGNCGFLFCVAGGDDECGDDAQVSVNTSTGSDYYILVHGAGAGARGLYTLLATKGANNDDCSGAIAVSCGSVVTGTTIGANTEVVPFCVESYTVGGVWYKIQGTGDPIVAELCGSAYDTKLFVYDGSCNFAALNCVLGNDLSCGLQSRVSWLSTNGTEYYILVSGFSSNQGNFVPVDCPP